MNKTKISTYEVSLPVHGVSYVIVQLPWNASEDEIYDAACKLSDGISESVTCRSIVTGNIQHTDFPLEMEYTKETPYDDEEA